MPRTRVQVSSEDVQFKLYYEGTNRFLHVKAPKFLEELFKNGYDADHYSRSSNWLGKDGTGLRFWPLSDEMETFVNAVARNNANSGRVSMDDFGLAMTLENFSLLRAVGITDGIDWNITNLQLVDLDIMKWCKNCYAYIYNIIRTKHGTVDGVANPFIIDVKIKALNGEVG